MESEIKEIISFIFKRSGKKNLTKTEFYLSLSIDLKWFSPNKANEFLNYIIDKKFLVEKNSLIRPNFNIEKYKIPFGFKPNINLMKSNINNTNKKKYIYISNLILNNNMIDKNNRIDLQNQILRIAKEKNIDVNVAALIVYKMENINIEEYLKVVEDQLLRGDS